MTLEIELNDEKASLAMNDFFSGNELVHAMMHRGSKLKIRSKFHKDLPLTVRSVHVYEGETNFKYNNSDFLIKHPVGTFVMTFGTSLCFDTFSGVIVPNLYMNGGPNPSVKPIMYFLTDEDDDVEQSYKGRGIFSSSGIVTLELLKLGSQEKPKEIKDFRIDMSKEALIGLGYLQK